MYKEMIMEKITFSRVKYIVEKYILKYPYGPNHERTLKYCYGYCRQFNFADDEHLRELVDEYFNN
jgi:hypothetical protein